MQGPYGRLVGSDNERLRLMALREELRKEREARAAAEQEVASLRAELSRVREFLEALPALGCSLGATTAAQELLMGAPHLAEKPRG